MRVLQFVTRLDLGGAQETCLQQCRQLLAAGHRVSLLTGDGGDLLEDARRIAGLELLVWSDWVHPLRPWRDARCLMRLVDLLRRERFDLLHTHCSKAGIVGRAAARLAGTPPRVVHHIHGWSFNSTQPPWTRRAYTRLEAWAARPGFILLACSEATRAQGRALGIGRDEDYRVIHYGIDRGRRPRSRQRAAARRRLGVGTRDLLFLQLSNLKPQKDPLTFARAAVVAGQRLPRARFWIAGDGPLRGAAEAVACGGGLGSRFRVLGWRRDVAALLDAADVLVLTSRFEGLPLAVLRGMAAGLPVVATAVDGTPEAVAPGGTGWLVPAGDAAATARAVIEAGSSSRRRARLGRRARAVSVRFDARRAGRETLALYDSLPAGPRGGLAAPLAGARLEADA